MVLVGALLAGIAVVLVLALQDGSGRGRQGEPVADGTTTRTTRTRATTAPRTTSTADRPTTSTATTAPRTASAPPADGDLDVRGGGTLTADDSSRDTAPGQPIAGTGEPATYVSTDGSWRTIIARPGNGWNSPRRTMQGSALERLRQSGPEGRLLLVDHTPGQAASFQTARVLETRTIASTPFGAVSGYRFMDARIGSIPECVRMQCVDVPLNRTADGPGWGVLVAAPTADEAWATAERLARVTGP